MDLRTWADGTCVCTQSSTCTSGGCLSGGCLCLYVKFHSCKWNFARERPSCASTSNLHSSSLHSHEWSFEHERKHPQLMCKAPFVQVEGTCTNHSHQWSCAHMRAVTLTSPRRAGPPRCGKIEDCCSTWKFLYDRIYKGLPSPYIENSKTAYGLELLLDHRHLEITEDATIGGEP